VRDLHSIARFSEIRHVAVGSLGCGVQYICPSQAMLVAFHRSRLSFFLAKKATKDTEALNSQVSVLVSLNFRISMIFLDDSILALS